MTQIIDVSPKQSGRMLSITSSPDGQVLFAGSYSNLWSSYDDGQTWNQVTWPQPDPSQFDAPGSLGAWCVVDIATALGWRVDKHPRFVAQLTRTGFADIVGFGECGVWTALGNGDGSFKNPNVVISDLGYQAGGWRVDRHPRFVVDLNGDGCADIVGFGDQYVWTAIGNGDGTFQAPQIGIANYCYQQDWRINRHPRFLAHLTDSGFADIVGFGEDGVWIALGNGDGTFREPLPNPVLRNFGYHQHWRVEKHPRFVANLTNSGFADIVGFGEDGVFVVLGNGDGTFREPHKNPVLDSFCYKQGWRVEKHPRCLAQLTSSGFDDIVGFGDAGVWTALSKGDGTFQKPNHPPVVHNFGYNQSWRVDQHPRFLAPLTNTGFADIVGFGDAGVWTALSNGDGTFADANYVLANHGVEQGWREDRHPRFVGDLTGSGAADIVGIGDAGVWTALGDRAGGFPASNFVLANFGYGMIVLALAVDDLVAGGRGIWRSADGGSNFSKVYQFPDTAAAGQFQWALGSDHLVYAAGGSALAISKNAGISFETVFPGGAGQRVNHVAVWQQAAADPAPTVIYALGDNSMFVSLNGGDTWIKDNGNIPQNVGGAVSPFANSNSPSIMVINPGWPLELYVAGNGSGADTPAMLYRANYASFFFGPQASQWDTVPLPAYLTATGPGQSNQDSGNVFLVTTKKGRGDLLFYGAQRGIPYVGPLYPSSGDDWIRLGGNVHADLHGILLSQDFKATISEDGTYQPTDGTVWLLSDGGIYRSADGGQHFQRTSNANTLSCVNIAGVANPGSGPVLSLNTGDNDGFYSADGGQNWTGQDYGGGDNSCSYADPLHSNSLLVFTPRRDLQGNTGSVRNGETVTVYETALGSLPNIGVGTPDRRIVPGPPLLPPDATFRDFWNADTSYGSRGSRPVVLGLPGEIPPIQGDYIFILDPSNAPVLVRTQDILEIVDRNEWITTATAPGQGAKVYLQGPPLPYAGLGLVQASGGHVATVFYVGGDNTLWSWKQGAGRWKQIVPANPIANRSVGADTAVRFFVSPYQPNLIYILDFDHVKRSDDGGQTWNVDTNLETQLTWNNKVPISGSDDSSGLGDHFDLILTDMQFDPNHPLLRFAVGLGGAFVTIDGINWTRLLHTGALTGRPANCYYDWISVPWNPSLYVAFAGRSVVKITDMPLSPVVIA